MKCNYVVTCENIVLEYNMQIMCNWMWCFKVDMFSMIIEYVFTTVVLCFTLVDYDFTSVEYNLILIEYKLNLIENVISLSRIYTHFSRKYNLI